MQTTWVANVSDQDNTVTIGERVATACHASNLRDEADRASKTDILKALAWSKSRLGAGLMRLQSEFDAIERPRPLTHEAMVSLALTMTGTPKEKQQKAKAEAAKWQLTEKTLFLGKLKTLPAIIEQVAIQCARWDIPEPRKVATVTVGHWLNQVCPRCHGLKFELIPDSPTLSAKQCKPCNGTGVVNAPYGLAGKKMLNYLDDCVSIGQRSIRERLKANHG